MDRGDVSTLRAALDRRHAVLEAVGTDVVNKRELTGRVSVSRSTVDRAVRELERLGLLERADGGFRRTAVGTLALHEYVRATERLAAIASSSHVLSALPTGVDVDVSVLIGADVVEATTDSPYEPVRYQNDLIRRADRIRGIATAVVPPQVELYRDEVVENGLEFTVVTVESTLDHLVSDYHETMVGVFDTGRFELYLTDEPIPYSLAVAESSTGTEMFLSVYDDDGIVGTIGNASPDAVAWANEQIDAYIDGADPIPQP